MSQVNVVADALARFAPTGDVLELAGGTGWWTQRLATIADRLTVVDASPETLDLNRRRVQRDDIDYVVADLFDWQSDRSYDVVFFSFWLSHVPRSRFRDFWLLVRSCLAPTGRVFLIDNRHDSARPAFGDPHIVERGEDLHRRSVGDGRGFHVVMVMYEPAELERTIESQGWRAHIDGTPWFLYGSAEPVDVA